MKEIKPLTSLRALAALLVFMFHYAYAFSPESRGIPFSDEWIPLMPLWRQGAVGVSLFFVLSGFLITRIYYDGVVRHTVSLRLFFVKRIARIWPLFLVFTVVQHGVMVLQGTPISDDFLVTMTMTQGFFQQLHHEGLPTAWSLTVEESFYVLAPLLFVILGRWAPRGDHAGFGLTWRQAFVRVIGLGVLTAVLVGLGEALVLLARNQGWAWKGLMGSHFHMWHSTIFGRFPEFAVGMFAAFVHRGVDLSRALRGWRATGLFVVTFAGIGACMWGKDLVADAPGTGAQLATYGLAYLLVVLAGGMILSLTVGDGIFHRFLSMRLMVYLGKISYGFYLVQLSVMMLPLTGLAEKLGAARLPVLLVLTNLFCAVVYQLVEVPTRRAIVARWGKKAG